MIEGHIPTVIIKYVNIIIIIIAPLSIMSEDKWGDL